MSIECNWFGPIFSPSGYSVVNRHLIEELVKLRVKINLVNHYTWDKMSLDKLNNEQRKILEKCLKNKFDKRVPTIFYTIPNAYFKCDIEPSIYNIGASMFEVDTIPKDWVEKLNKMDEIWVPNIFNYQTYYSSGVSLEKIKVFPLGVDSSTFKKRASRTIIKNKRTFAFLSISQWTHRKGFDVLINAFIEEFSHNEDVCLIIKSYHADDSEQSNNVIRNEIKELVKDKNHPPILFYKGVIETDQLVDLYNSCDCFVSPTRGEGWHLTLIEAIACKLPTIVTNYSGHKMFVNRENSFLIDYNLKNIDAQKMAWMHYGYKNTKCAEPSKEHLKELMRLVYNNRTSDDIKIKIESAYNLIQEDFTWKKSAIRIRDRLNEINRNV